MEKFFESEVKDTVQKLNQLKEEGCFCFNVVTDSHVSPTNPQWVARQWHTFQNIKAVNQGAEVDAIFHLGDIFGCVDCITDGFALKFWNEENTKEWFGIFKRELTAANQNAFFVAGNHDNLKAGEPTRSIWSREMVEPIKDKISGYKEGEMYYYVDFPESSVRAICLMSNSREGEQGEHKNYGIYPEQVEWLVNDALKAPNGWSILLFSHIYPANDGISSARQDNVEEFAGLLKAFQNKEKFESEIFSGDFRNHRDAKIVAMFVGHGHVDWLHGPDKLPFWVVETGSNHVHVPERSDWNMPDDAVVPPREYDTVTEDLWDAVIYNPKKKTIDVIRFGSGNDRHIDL